MHSFTSSKLRNDLKIAESDKCILSVRIFTWKTILLIYHDPVYVVIKSAYAFRINKSPGSFE